MLFEWDTDKEEQNRVKHGMGFDLAHAFRWDEAITLYDDRRDYGEHRLQAFGLIGKKLHVIVFTMRGNNRRIISLRRANKREEKFYETQKAH